MTTLAGLAVLLVGLWLIGFAAWVLLAPARAKEFLSRFAGSFRAHTIEMVLRIVAGWGFIQYAPAMRFPAVAEIFGWVLVASSVVLLLLPWRLHNRFAARVMPSVYRHIAIYAVLSCALGVLVLYAAY